MLSTSFTRETWVRSQIESYQRLKKWYLMPPCLTLSIIRYGSRVKWSNPGKGVAPSPTPWCSKLSKREPSGHPRLWSPTLLLHRLQEVRGSFYKLWQLLVLLQIHFLTPMNLQSVQKILWPTHQIGGVVNCSFVKLAFQSVSRNFLVYVLPHCLYPFAYPYFF